MLCLQAKGQLCNVNVKFVFLHLSNWGSLHCKMKGVYVIIKLKTLNEIFLFLWVYPLWSSDCLYQNNEFTDLLTKCDFLCLKESLCRENYISWFNFNKGYLRHRLIIWTREKTKVFPYSRNFSLSHAIFSLIFIRAVSTIYYQERASIIKAKGKHLNRLLLNFVRL